MATIPILTVGKLVLSDSIFLNVDSNGNLILHNGSTNVQMTHFTYMSGQTFYPTYIDEVRVDGLYINGTYLSFFNSILTFGTKNLATITEGTPTTIKNYMNSVYVDRLYFGSSGTYITTDGGGEFMCVHRSGNTSNGIVNEVIDVIPTDPIITNGSDVVTITCLSDVTGMPTVTATSGTITDLTYAANQISFWYFTSTLGATTFTLSNVTNMVSSRTFSITADNYDPPTSIISSTNGPFCANTSYSMITTLSYYIWKTPSISTNNGTVTSVHYVESPDDFNWTAVHYTWTPTSANANSTITFTNVTGQDQALVITKNVILPSRGLDASLLSVGNQSSIVDKYNSSTTYTCNSVSVANVNGYNEFTLNTSGLYSNSWTVCTEWTCIVVVKFNNVSSGSYEAVVHGGQSDFYYALLKQQNGLPCTFGNPSGIPQGTSISSNTWYVIATGSSHLTGTSFISINGGTPTTSDKLGDCGLRCIGINAASGNFPFRGSIREIQFYDVDIINIVPSLVSSLRTKWNF